VHIAPYFLRLNLPGNVLEDDESSAIYNPSSGFLTVTLTKEIKGQEFPDLDLLAKLLAPKPTQAPTRSNPVIEVLASHLAGDKADGGDDDLVSRTQGLSLDHQDLTTEEREILEGAHISIALSSP
jgi:protein SHQ1